jgi:hypothetical protein
MVACGIGYGVVRLAGWGELRWIATGVPIMTGVIAMALFNVWNTRHVRH